MYFKRSRIPRFWVAAILIVVFDDILIDASPIFSGNIFDSFIKRMKSAIRPSNKSKNASSDICSTPGCIKAAQNIVNNMNENINPCDDFYHFACGNFLKQTRIPDDKPNLSQFSIVSDMILDQLKVIITESVANEIKPFKQVKDMYNSCMNQEKIEKLGLTPMKNLFRKLGGWPVLENDWNDELFSCQEIIHKCREEGISVDLLIYLTIHKNIKNASTTMINIDQPSFGIDRRFLVQGLDNQIVDAYYRYMVDIAVIFGADRNRAAKELKQSLEFEINLANITSPPEHRRHNITNYQLINIVEAQRRFPVVAWLKYINTILAPVNKITADEIILIIAPEYLIKLDKLLSVTPKRVLANFFLSRIAGSTALFLTKQVRKRLQEFSIEVTGRATEQPRWKECVFRSLGSFGVAIGSLYVRRHFNEESKKEALELVKGIRREMYKRLSTVDWMDDLTRKHALDKAFAILNLIGYPDELMDNNKLLKFYEKLETDPENYLGSVMNVTKFWSDLNYSKLKKPINKTDWITHGAPTIVNAYYDRLENSLKFPAGILQHIFFSHDRPRYLNYGAIGFIVGHEITHAFDDQGSRVDKDGNLVSWWSTETKKQFSEKAQCFIEQTSNFAPKGSTFKINGVSTLEEVIADNGGIGNAYHAYLEFVKKHGNETKLPNLLKYTAQQMFWIAAANVWCTKERPESFTMSMQTNVHPPAEFRVTGIFANQEEFARDFNCPAGSTMNPVSRCKIW